MSAHRIRWFARFPDTADDWTPRTRSMVACSFAWDARCTCGWETSTGGAVVAEINRKVRQHRQDAYLDHDGSLFAVAPATTLDTERDQREEQP